MNEVKTLIVLVGLPRSGKSTWSKHMSWTYGWPVVNRDSVRLALHGKRFLPEAEGMVAEVTRLMVKALFIAGHATVILDECNVTEKQREEWQNPLWTVKYKYVDTPKETCIARAIADNDAEIIPVIERMAAELDFTPIPGLMV
jgi:predicted kinase